MKKSTEEQFTHDLKSILKSLKMIKYKLPARNENDQKKAFINKQEGDINEYSTYLSKFNTSSDKKGKSTNIKSKSDNASFAKRKHLIYCCLCMLYVGGN